MPKISNRDLSLTPSSPPDGRMLEFDFPGLEIGCAQYAEGPTGCTTFYFPNQARFALDIRGGAPGVVVVGQWESGCDLLDAVCFTGGSCYGFEAIAGVTAAIFEEREYSTYWRDLANVPGAVIHDFRPRSNAIYPDKALGEASFKGRKAGRFPMGRVGAGAAASVGKLAGAQYWEFAGQGAAFQQIGEVKVAAFTVVNSVGAIIDRQGRTVRGLLDTSTGKRLTPSEAALESASTLERGNTTLSLVVTNQKVEPHALQQLARQAHA